MPEEIVEGQEEEIIEGVDDNNLEGSDGAGEGAEGNQGAEEDSPEEIAEAKRVYKLLQNPATAKNLVRELARAEGLLDAPPANKIEERAAKASIKDILKEKLGDKYEFLIPQLSDALETILGNERETHQQSVQQIQIDATKRETADVLAKLARETKGESRKLESQMLELMNEFQIGPGVPIEKYLRGLYAQASSARNVIKSKNQQTDRINRNANDVPSRLQSSSGAETRPNAERPAGVDPNKRLSVKEAVQLAVQQQEQQGKRK